MCALVLSIKETDSYPFGDAKNHCVSDDVLDFIRISFDEPLSEKEVFLSTSAI